jgi:hypothetical protein
VRYKEMPISLPSQITKTLICAYFELENLSPTSMRDLTDYTLNSKYGILPSEISTSKPTFGYFGVGIKGFKNLDDGQLSAPYIPGAENMDLFEPIPFRIVPVTEDLSNEERAKYRMRVLKNVNGTDYWAYYLKKVEILDERVKFIETDLTTRVETELNTLDSNKLNPIPITTTAEGTVTATSEIITAITINLQITGAEVREAIDVLYDGNLLKLKISEIGIYTGEDKAHVGSDNTSYTEAIYAHLAYHYCNLGDDFSDINKIDDRRMRISSAKAFLI